MTAWTFIFGWTAPLVLSSSQFISAFVSRRELPKVHSSSVYCIDIAFLLFFFFFPFRATAPRDVCLRPRSCDVALPARSILVACPPYVLCCHLCDPRLFFFFWHRAWPTEKQFPLFLFLSNLARICADRRLPARYEVHIILMYVQQRGGGRCGFIAVK